MRRFLAARFTLALVLLAFASAGASFVLLGKGDSGTSSSGAQGRLSVDFQPDGRTISSCEPGDTPCLRQAFGNVAHRDGAAAALSQLEQTFATGSKFDPNCHSIAHFVGFGALAHHRGNVGAALAEGNATCSSGYYHGVLTMAFDNLRLAELPDRARTLCAAPELAANRHAQGECVHGLGHGLMLVTSYDLPRSLRICDQQPEQARQACYGGVLMENHMPSLGASTKWLRQDDVEYPCHAIADRYRTQCYMQLVVRLRDADTSWERTVGVCTSVAVAWQEACLRFVGYAAEGESRETSASVLDVCRLAGARQAVCIAGAAHTRIAFFKDEAGAAALCAAAPVAARGQCAREVATSLAGTGRDAAAAACRRPVSPDTRACATAQR